ncbi:prospero homeobox protein 1 isoform X2 [Carassius auratus]|uniref:Prospero homeobox protein 1-like isoform X1 n=1 Tax=Carassius auratus TaxID=7957 RepID=A0A6P6R5E6_CARAU|nr:prospero homeobox protein 1-like isoform X1 [Carassius auratus]XP_026141024.1 prospero homeobox protein 1-like isoform X2 [Carassius auratus]
MNLNPSEHSMDGSKAEHLLPCFRRSAFDEPLASYHSGSIISHLLRKTLHNKLSSLDNSLLYLPSANTSGLDPESSSTDGFAQEEQSRMSFKDEDLSVSEHLQAKRARVENIIRGMAASPNADREAESESEAVRCRRDLLKENKRKQRLPQHQEPSQSNTKTSKDQECHRLKEQLQSMQRLLHQLQEKISHVHDQSYSENEEREDARSEQSSLRLDGGYKDQVKVETGGLGSDTAMENLKETLKCELTRTVSESIDTVFKKLSTTLLNQSSPCHSPDCSGTEKRIPEDSPLDLSDSEEHVKSRHCFESHVPEHQTEALSLVVRKPSLSQAVKRPHPLHQTPFQMGYSAPLHDSQILEHLLKYGPHSSFCLERPSPDSMERPWESLALRSKLSSGHLGQHQTGLVSVDALCLPHVKMECGDLQSMAERSSFMTLNIQEGLSPNHLKKAKLMFFYTRYPSSNLLKNFFPDVKFNRCITSQLIKWFSNFREFYYIQMEKFARQAIVDGVNDVKDISVTRESELFRSLNMHYNKANDFQVPDRFLEVAEVTLQEFFSAISLSKDSDPSWKKAIYKVICKLDSDVPEDFKSTSYL